MSNTSENQHSEKTSKTLNSLKLRFPNAQTQLEDASSRASKTPRESNHSNLFLKKQLNEAVSLNQAKTKKLNQLTKELELLQKDRTQKLNLTTKKNQLSESLPSKKHRLKLQNNLSETLKAAESQEFTSKSLQYKIDNLKKARVKPK